MQNIKLSSKTSKKDKAEVNKIFNLRLQGLTIQKISEIIGLSTCTISNILDGKSRNHNQKEFEKLKIKIIKAFAMKNAKQINKIFSMRKQGFTYQQIADETNYTIQNICHIFNGRCRISYINKSRLKEIEKVKINIQRNSFNNYFIISDKQMIKVFQMRIDGFTFEKIRIATGFVNQRIVTILNGKFKNVNEELFQQYRKKLDIVQEKRNEQYIQLKKKTKSLYSRGLSYTKIAQKVGKSDSWVVNVVLGKYDK